MNSRTAYITYQNFQLILSATQSLYVGTELTVVRDDNDATMMPHLYTLLYNNVLFKNFTTLAHCKTILYIHAHILRVKIIGQSERMHSRRWKVVVGYHGDDVRDAVSV